MRSLVQPALAGRARPPVRFFLVFAALALVAHGAQRILSGGLTPSGVETFYLGVDGGEPLSAVALWEELHVGAFVYGFVLFMLGALLAVCPVGPRVRTAAYAAAFVATVADLLAPFAVSALHGAGVIRVVTFIGALGTLGALLGVVLVTYGRGGADARA